MAKAVYVEGPFGDIYRIEDKGYGSVKVTNIDHPAPVVKSAWDVVEELQAGLYRSTDQSSAAALDTLLQFHRNQ